MPPGLALNDGRLAVGKLITVLQDLESYRNRNPKSRYHAEYAREYEKLRRQIILGMGDRFSLPDFLYIAPTLYLLDTSDGTPHALESLDRLEMCLFQDVIDTSHIDGKFRELPDRGRTVETLKFRIQSLQFVCRRLVQDFSVQREDAAAYRQLRVELETYGLGFMPETVIQCATAKHYRDKMTPLAATRERVIDLLDYDFSSVLRRLKAGQTSAIAAKSIPASEWTGRKTPAQRVMAVRQFAPIVLAGLDQIIDLHQKVIDNREPTVGELKALVLLRQLHSDVGALLDAVDQGRAYKSALNRVLRRGRRLFSIRAETQELLVAGVPALSATAVATLAVWGGLEWMCGVDVSETGIAAIGTVAGGVFGAHSVVKRSKGARAES